GVGMNGISGLGVGIGKCDNPPCTGFGHGRDRLPGTYVPKAGPTVRTLAIDVNGHIPPEVIQRIVRQNAGRYRACYEAGLRTNPSLSGRVAVMFVIGRDGAVSLSADAGAQSDMPDMSVRNCVVKSFYNLSFPQPQGGTVRVTYPLMFTPSE
ncbi:MAG: AgmX/PglI C-terminal domain-containing protein, partial [Polyangiaceae bacterium]